MIGHALRIAAGIAGAGLCAIVPFLPGRYDPMAVTVSMMAQVFGLAGLIIVPVGLLWMVAEHRGRSTRRRAYAIAALIVCSAVWLLISFVAIIESPIAGVVLLMLGGFVATAILRRVRAQEGESLRGLGSVPLYLISIPVGAALVQLSLADPAAEFGRNRAITNSATLIADIEAYRVANGQYPLSVVSVNRDYSPSVLGIREYRYEPSGDAYNVFFEQHSLRLGIREIVMYNPQDRQAIASHALDVLQLTPAQLDLDRTRGYNAVYAAGQKHWKYFWFD
jgi:MFS family permease